MENEFKAHIALQKAKDYASGMSSSEVFRKQHEIDYLTGYKNAIEDSKAPEMLEKLSEVRKWYEENQSRLGDYTPVIFSEINDLIKEATTI